MTFKGSILMFMMTVILMACSTASKNSASAITESPKKPIRPTEETIEINSILAEGVLNSKNQNQYFEVNKVIKRGRSAPIVLSGQRLKLEMTALKQSLENKTITAILTCPTPQPKECIWTLKIIQK